MTAPVGHGDNMHPILTPEYWMLVRTRSFSSVFGVVVGVLGEKLRNAHCFRHKIPVAVPLTVLMFLYNPPDYFRRAACPEKQTLEGATPAFVNSLRTLFEL